MEDLSPDRQTSLLAMRESVKTAGGGGGRVLSRFALACDLDSLRSAALPAGAAQRGRHRVDEGRLPRADAHAQEPG
jgi:hypothetical protein